MDQQQYCLSSIGLWITGTCRSPLWARHRAHPGLVASQVQFWTFSRLPLAEGEKEPKWIFFPEIKEGTGLLLGDEGDYRHFSSFTLCLSYSFSCLQHLFDSPPERQIQVKSLILCGGFFCFFFAPPLKPKAFSLLILTSSSFLLVASSQSAVCEDESSDWTGLSRQADGGRAVGGMRRRPPRSGQSPDRRYKIGFFLWVFFVQWGFCTMTLEKILKTGPFGILCILTGALELCLT